MNTEERTTKVIGSATLYSSYGKLFPTKEAAEERTKAIDYANFHSSYGKWSLAKEAVLELTWCFTQDEYRENAKEVLLWMALYHPERLLEFTKALCWFKRFKRTWRDKCPHGEYLIGAYVACDSFPPTFSEAKRVFIAKFGKKKWNGGNEDDPSRGDYSARKALKALRLPLAKTKPGRRSGSKSLRVTK